MKGIDPMWRLFFYACDKFYCIEYGNEYKPYTIKGLLLNYGTQRCAVLTEDGLYLIKTKKIITMHPIPMPEKLSDNFRSVIETYLKERAKQK